MVYAMMSIGLLGFIVWSQNKMALPYSDIWVINFAICWNSLVLLSTLNSKNLNNYTQSAGNQKLSSSETIREGYFSHCPLDNNLKGGISKEGKYRDLDYNWLIWFIGFTEGDGALLTHKNRLKFVLTQKESEILYHIQEKLGFGTVKHFTGGFSRFIVDAQKDIIKLVHIFNGNLVLPTRINQLSLWIAILNSKGLNQKPCIMKPVKITLSDAWLSGFTDAEGCFNVSIQKRIASKFCTRIILRFILDQKNAENLFTSIKNLLNYGSVSLRVKTNNVFRFTINSFEGLIQVKEYFLKFPLKTKKKQSFENWLIIQNMVLNKEHLDLEGLEKIKKIKKNINLNNSLTRKTGKK